MGGRVILYKYIDNYDFTGAGDDSYFTHTYIGYYIDNYKFTGGGAECI